MYVVFVDVIQACSKVFLRFAYLARNNLMFIIFVIVLGSLKVIFFSRTFLLVSIKGLCLKVFLVHRLLVV